MRGRKTLASSCKARLAELSGWVSPGSASQGTEGVCTRSSQSQVMRLRVFWGTQYIYLYIYMHTHTCRYRYTYAYTYLYTDMYTYIYIHTYINIYVKTLYTYIHIHIILSCWLMDHYRVQKPSILEGPSMGGHLLRRARVTPYVIPEGRTS